MSNEEPAITEYNILDIPKPHQSNTPAETSPQPNGRPEEAEAGMSKKAMKKAKTAEIKAKAQAALEAKRGMRMVLLLGVLVGEGALWLMRAFWGLCCQRCQR